MGFAILNKVVINLKSLLKFLMNSSKELLKKRIKCIKSYNLSRVILFCPSFYETFLTVEIQTRSPYENSAG